MIMVTGGAGFIGSNFVLGWCRDRDEGLVNLDLLTYAGNSDLKSLDRVSKHVFVRGDILDAPLLNRLLADYRPRAVVHFAAESHVDRSILGPEAFVQTNVVGTYRLLESVRSHWEGLKGGNKDDFRFVHVSTDEVYGTLTPDAPPFTETTPYAPNSPYSASKAAGDHMARASCHTYGLPVLTTNCSNNYGPFQFPEKLIPLVLHRALKNEPLPVYGDGLQVRDWLYVEDHCRAVMRVLDAGIPGEVYNIGGGHEETNLNIVYSLCDALDATHPREDGRTYREQITFVRDRPGHDRRYAVDASKIKRELGWRSLETFASGLQKTVAWYLDNESWVERVTSGAYRDWVELQYEEGGRGRE